MSVSNLAKGDVVFNEHGQRNQVHNSPAKGDTMRVLRFLIAVFAPVFFTLSGLLAIYLLMWTPGWVLRKLMHADNYGDWSDKWVSTPCIGALVCFFVAMFGLLLLELLSWLRNEWAKTKETP